MAKFMCNQSGNVFEFAHEHDIKSMRTHSEYTEIIPQEERPVVIKPKKAATVKQEQTL